MILALLLALAAAPVAAAHAPALRGVGVEETLDAAPLLGPALEQAKTPPGVPVFVRLSLSAADLAADPGPAPPFWTSSWAVRGAQGAGRGRGRPPARGSDQIEAWKARLRDIAVGKARAACVPMSSRPAGRRPRPIWRSS